MESQLTISPLNRSAISSARTLLPAPVGPSTRTSGLTTRFSGGGALRLNSVLRLEGRYGIDKGPRKKPYNVHRRHDVQKQIVVAVIVLEDVAADRWSGKAREIAHHVHRSGNRSRIFAANVHAGSPRARHVQIVTETGHAHCQNRPNRVLKLTHQEQKYGAARESGAA